MLWGDHLGSWHNRHSLSLFTSILEAKIIQRHAHACHIDILSLHYPSIGSNLHAIKSDHISKNISKIYTNPAPNREGTLQLCRLIREGKDMTCPCMPKTRYTIYSIHSWLQYMYSHATVISGSKPNHLQVTLLKGSGIQDGWSTRTTVKANRAPPQEAIEATMKAANISCKLCLTELPWNTHTMQHGSGKEPNLGDQGLFMFSKGPKCPLPSSSGNGNTCEVVIKWGTLVIFRCLQIILRWRMFIPPCLLSFVA